MRSLPRACVWVAFFSVSHHYFSFWILLRHVFVHNIYISCGKWVHVCNTSFFSVLFLSPPPHLLIPLPWGEEVYNFALHNVYMLCVALVPVYKTPQFLFVPLWQRSVFPRPMIYLWFCFLFLFWVSRIRKTRWYLSLCLWCSSLNIWPKLHSFSYKRLKFMFLYHQVVSE